MSRTYRRRGARHEYRWVLREWSFASAGYLAPVMLDRHSPEGRRAIARFHSDTQVTLGSGPPRWFRRIFEKRHRNANARQLLRWLANPEYDPVMNARHRHSAKWAWW
jgi:hypothetical protein